MSAVDFLFEVSSEVANKVGGIYTVIKSKSHYICEEYGENYLTVGPYNERKAAIEFDEEKPPADYDKVFKELSQKGIKCHYGMWLIPGRPKAVLLEYESLLKDINKLQDGYYKSFQVDSYHSGELYDNMMAFSTAAAMLIECLIKTKSFTGKKCVAHFHEWLSAAGLLYLADNNVEVATVFTTHATTLGRTLAGSGVDIYDLIGKGHDGEHSLKLARQYGVIAKHSLELAAAQKATVFTTVSEVTAREARFFLQRDADVLLLNGLDTEKYPGIEDLAIIRRKNRNQTRDFLASYFLRYYDLDLFNIRTFYISGRHEFKNKGLDVFIEALGLLNERLRKEKSEKSVVAFIWVPAEHRGENFQVLKNKALYEQMNDHVEEELPEIKDSILHSMMHGEIPNNVFSESFLTESKKIIAHFTEHRGQNPPVCAFELANKNDEILKACEENKLLNKAEDKVKVIYYPAYLSPADRLISLEYNDAIVTCDAGVFPSYYEPWGYTPVENAAQGGLAITTDLAGFGKFIEGKGHGIYVLKRDDRKHEDVVSDLSEKLHEIATMPKEKLTRYRMDAKELCKLADWKKMIKFYFAAHKKAADSLK